jgi:branched-chain amino acid transport system ATP-binding protein
MLEIERLAVSYGEVAALRDVSLTINQGEIVALIGGNGAGKTTTLKTISGLLAPSAGSIRFEGESIVGLSPDRIVASGIVQVPEGRHVFPRLSVEDNLYVGAYLVRDTANVRNILDKVYAMFPQLKERRHQLGETLSGGEQQMLALGRAIMARPRLMLLDEPSLGLAPRIVEEVAKVIIAFRRSGMTILLVEQNARVALAISKRGYVLETGRVVLSADSAALKRNPRVIASYLGVDKNG